MYSALEFIDDLDAPIQQITLLPRFGKLNVKGERLLEECHVRYLDPSTHKGHLTDCIEIPLASGPFSPKGGTCRFLHTHDNIGIQGTLNDKRIHTSPVLLMDPERK